MRLIIALAIATKTPVDYWLTADDAVILTALEILEESNHA